MNEKKNQKLLQVKIQYRTRNFCFLTSLLHHQVHDQPNSAQRTSQFLMHGN